MKEKYSLAGIDGNAFVIMGYVMKAMKREGYKKDDIDDYYKKATAGNYDDLIVESLDMVEKLNNRAKEN